MHRVEDFHIPITSGKKRERGGEGAMAAHNLYRSDPAGTNWRARISTVGFHGIYELAPTDFRNFLGDPQDADDVDWRVVLCGLEAARSGRCLLLRRSAAQGHS